MPVNNNSVAMTMRRLKGRERLMRLASEAPAYTTGDREWDRLKAYLLEWASRQKEISAARRDSSESCLAAYMKTDSPSASSILSGSDSWAMGVIDASITDLLALPDGVEMHAAIRVRYLQEGMVKRRAFADALNDRASQAAGMEVRVFRSKRIQYFSIVEADALADKAEVLLIVKVKSKGLPL